MNEHDFELLKEEFERDIELIEDKLEKKANALNAMAYNVEDGFASGMSTDGKQKN